MRDVLYPERHESLKGAVHLAALGLGLLCFGYNIAAWVARREKHLRLNTVIYGAYVGWELTCATGHLCHREEKK